MKIQKNTDGNAYLTMFYGKESINQDEMQLLYADVNYTTLTLLDGSRVIISYTLKKFEEMLPEHEFVRPNRSSLVNIRYIKSVTSRELILKDNSRIKISRRRQNEVIEKLRNLQEIPTVAS